MCTWAVTVCKAGLFHASHRSMARHSLEGSPGLPESRKRTAGPEVDECKGDFSPIINSASILAIRQMSRMRLSQALTLLFCAALAALAQSSEPNNQTPDKQDILFVKRLQEISARGGGQVVDCGFTGINHPDNSVTECGKSAFEQHRPFLLGYEYRVWDEPVQSGYGLASDATGNVFAVGYRDRGFPSVPLNHHTQQMDDDHNRVAECIKPITLNTSQRGLLGCVTPINQELSDIAAHQKPVDTTICAILANPPAFNNKMVRIRGSYVGNFEYSELTDAACHGGIWLRYGTAAGPSTLAASVTPTNEFGSEDSEGKRILPVPVVLVRDSKFERFDALIGMNTGRYGPSSAQRVTATFIGRIDAVSEEVFDYLQKQPVERRIMLGFGQGGAFEAQFTLQSVEDNATLQ